MYTDNKAALEARQKYIDSRKESELLYQKNVALEKLKNLTENEKMALGYLSKSLQLVPAAKVQELLHIMKIAG